MLNLATEVVQALHEDKLVLHPTDTIPGLTFDPRSLAARSALVALKKRDADKPISSLVSSFEVAQKYWQPLPKGWNAKIQEVWPAPLTVIWQASALVPEALKSNDGSLGMRMPLLAEGAQWYRKVLEDFAIPMPSTSVNFAGEPACEDWESAVKFCHKNSIFSSPQMPFSPLGGSPSTVIKIQKNGDFSIIREGGFVCDWLKSKVEV